MIVFGTDGWRGLIARDFTFENVRIVALAVSRYIHSIDPATPSAVIGYDARFLSREFAEEVALVLASNGVVAHLTSHISSTPQVSYATKQKKTTLGIVITASHNPPEYNGFKVKGNFGGPATPEQIKEIEQYVARVEAERPTIAVGSLADLQAKKKIRMFNAKESFLRYIRRKIDIQAIVDSNLRVVYDTMYGAGVDTLEYLLPNVDQLHTEYNPSFGEIHHPEPMQENLQILIDTVRSKGYSIGIATDGDADRLGAVDEEGSFVDSHRVFMLLMKYLYEDKGKRGCVAKTVSLTSMVDKYCAQKGIRVIETPVGFKYIAQLMNEQKVLIGGEESGGLGTILHIPERDGIFNALLLLEMMVYKKKSLKQLCDELDEEFGIHRYRRRDVRVTQEEKERILAACKKGVARVGQFEVLSTQTTDGYKFFINNGWLLIRASGTEPLVRFYAEADSMATVSELLDEAIKLA